MLNLNPDFLSWCLKKTVGTEVGDIDTSTETKIILASTPNGMSDQKIGNTSNSSITSEEVACQIKFVAASDPLTRHLGRLCDLVRKLIKMNNRVDVTKRPSPSKPIAPHPAVDSYLTSNISKQTWFSRLGLENRYKTRPKRIWLLLVSNLQTKRDLCCCLRP